MWIKFFLNFFYPNLPLVFTTGTQTTRREKSSTRKNSFQFNSKIKDVRKRANKFIKDDNLYQANGQEEASADCNIADCGKLKQIISIKIESQNEKQKQIEWNFFHFLWFSCLNIPLA